MIKTLRYSMLSLLMLVCGMASATTIDFTQLAITKTSDGFTLTSDGYTFTASKEKGQTAPTQNGTSKDIRLYAKNSLTVSGKGFTKMVFTLSDAGLKQCAENTASVGTMAVDVDAKTVTWTNSSAVDEVVITVGDKNVYGSNTSKTSGQFDFNSVEITADGGGTPAVTVAAPTFSLDGGVYTTPQTLTLTPAEGTTAYYTLDGTAPTKESTAYTAPIAIEKTTTVKAIAYDAAGNASKVVTETYTFPVACASIADVKALETGALVELTLANAQVVYVNSYTSNDVTNTEYYVRDATGAIDLYNTGLELALGKVINGKAVFEYKVYNGMPELVKTDATNGEGLTVTDGAAVVPTRLTVADLADEEHLCDLVEVANVHFSTEKSGNYTNNYILSADGADKVMIYNKFKLDGFTIPAADDSKSYTVVGILGSAKLSGSIVMELFPTMTIENATAGIADVKANVEANGVIYNLAGQRMAKLQKGLNIVNGKKLLVK